MPNPPAADLVGHMHESLRGMRKLIEDIDCAALTAAEAARLYRFFDAAENVAAAGMTMVLPIVNEAASRR